MYNSQEKNSMNAKEMAEIVAREGGRMFLVGGAVRDQMMGQCSSDLDYCVSGLSETKFNELFPESFSVGNNFPVWIVEIDGRQVECALARTEQKDGVGHRGFHIHSDAFVTIEQDLKRRDLTINAMAIDVLSGELIDPFGGLSDIEHKCIRAVSETFADDPLRVYRAARFAAQLKFDIDDETIALMHTLKSELSDLPVERVYEETKKALNTDQPSLFFRSLQKAGVLDVHYKEVDTLYGVPQSPVHHPEGDAFEHTMRVLDAAARLSDRTEVRFSALVHDVGKGVTDPSLYPVHINHERAGVPLVQEMCDRLRLPNHWRDAALFATEQHMKLHTLSGMREVKVVDLLEKANQSRLGVDGFAVIGLADTRGRDNPEAEHPDAQGLQDLWQRMTTAVNGNTIQTNTTGEKFGEALRVERAKFLKKERQSNLSDGKKRNRDPFEM